jgi:hypothetical protein
LGADQEVGVTGRENQVVGGEFESGVGTNPKMAFFLFVRNLLAEEVVLKFQN